MSDAYRDDLDAARARVSDLEREAARLRTRNAELEAMVEPDEKAEPIAAPTPEPTRGERTLAGLAKLCFAGGLVAVTGPRFQHTPYTPHFGWSAIFLGLGFVFWCCSGFQRLWR